MSYLLSLIRRGLGHLLVFFDWLTRPSPIERSPEQQREVEEQLQDLSLYQFHGCPFCVKVRREAHRLNLPLELRDAQNNPEHRSELEQRGGEIQVPCLRIDRDDETTWLYESDEIIQYLQDRFAPNSRTETANTSL